MPAVATHLLVFALAAAAAWCLAIYFWPRLLLSVYKRALLVKGFGGGPIPLNTLYTQPQELFAQPLSAQTGKGSNMMTVGVNHDTLSTAAWLDLRRGPLVLHVPDTAGRYYSVQFTDPRTNTNFAYVGKRATGTQAGDYLIAGPGGPGQAPGGLPRVSAPTHEVLLLARVLVENDADLPAAYELSRQFQLTPLSEWHSAAGG
jgi:hypothetical protein